MRAVLEVVRSCRRVLELGAFNYAAIAASLAINVLVTRLLGVEAFGQLALLVTTSQMLSMVAANWTLTGTIRFAAREYETSHSVVATFWARIWIVLPCALVTVVALLAARAQVSAYLNVPASGITLVVVHFAATFANSTVGALLQARNLTGRYGALLFLDKALTAGGLLVAGAWLPGNPLLVLALYALGSSGATLWAMATFGWRRLVPVTFSRTLIAEMSSFSLPLIASGWVGLLGTTWFDLLVLRWYRSFAEIGAYSLGTALAGVVQQVVVVFSTVLLPRASAFVARGEFERIDMLVDRVVPYWLFATSVLFSSVIVGAAIVPVIFGRSFDASAHVLATLMLASAAVAVYSVFATLLYAIGATWALTALQLGSGAVNVVMDLVLIPRYGAPGAALATVCASGVAALGALGVARDRLSLPRVRRQLTLGLPVVVVYACFAIFGGARFYPVAIAAGAGASCWLVSAFRLFSKDALERLGDAHVFSPGPTAGMLAADRRAGSR